ncbi:MAG: DUF3316 domain-containing protein [Bacteroidaceae bacterium]|nr:DUF3316 domain-containing protein [Bacteroidaceae bacterium]
MNRRHKTTNRGLAIAVTLLLSLCASAQHFSSNKEVMHSTILGVGSSNVLDSYLSPYNYSGPEIRVVRETMRMTRLMGGHVAYQTIVNANASYVENRSGNVNEYAGGVRYSNAWLYDFGKLKTNIPGLRLFVGPAASGYIGGVYNTRNGNNPGQLKMDIMVDAEAVAMYDLKLWNRIFGIQYQLSVPLLGCAFSPAYGQSYYEIFELGYYDHNAVFAYPGNMPSWRHLLTVDIPVKKSIIRVGYCGEFMQTKFNSLKYHSYSHDFMIGWTKYFGRK